MYCMCLKKVHYHIAIACVYVFIQQPIIYVIKTQSLPLYLYICTYMCICISPIIYVVWRHMCLDVCVCMRMYHYVYVCKCIYIYIVYWTLIYEYIIRCIRKYVNVNCIWNGYGAYYVYIYIYIYIFIYIYIYLNIYTAYPSLSLSSGVKPLGASLHVTFCPSIASERLDRSFQSGSLNILSVPGEKLPKRLAVWIGM